MVAAKLFQPENGRQRVDRYELVGEIASGGMATVFLARLTGVGGFQRFVAIKRLHPHLAGEKEFVEMFLDEARLAAGIHHSNVVSILEVGASPTGYYLVMEYVEGDTLARLLARAAGKGQRLPTGIALRIVLDMLFGLHGAHELRDDQGRSLDLVHRDVSPQNVLVGIDGVARITDFGVARATSRLTSTRVGQLKGKLAYMAPEQAQGDALDRRADVFSAGILIWETLAAKRLFKAENEAATLSRVMNEPIPDLTRVAPHLSKELAQVVKRGLDRDREKRFSTTQQFAEALEAAATGRDGIATAREVATFVKEMIGQEIEQQREAVRAWIARSEPSQVGALAPPSAPSSVSVAAMSLPGEGSRSVTQEALGMAEPRRSRASLFAVVVALFGAAGAAGFFLAQSATEPTPAAVPVPAPAPLPTPSASPPATVAPTAEATTSSVSPSALVTAEPPPPRAVTPAPRAPGRAVRKKKDDALDVRNPYR
jgi:eukaryotic-like serine/threonine-protein kinase